MVATNSHHHRSTTRNGHKAFKSRHATKGTQKTKTKGKIEGEDKIRRTTNQMMQTKLERRNQARQRLLHKHSERTESDKIFNGRKGASRNVLVVPLCSNTDSQAVVTYLNASIDNTDPVGAAGLCDVSIDRFKQKIRYLMPRRDYLSMLDAAKFADFVLFTLSAHQEVDELGEAVLRAIEAQGVSNIMTVIQDLNMVEPAKRRPDIKKSLLSYIKHFFASEEKVHAIDTTQEALNVVRHLCTARSKGIIWRDARSYVLAEDMAWDDATGGLVITGTVRGRGLKADRLVHLQGHGDYQIDKICSIHDASSDPNAMDTTDVLDAPTEDQDTLDQFDVEELPDTDSMSMMSSEPKRGVLLDEHHYFDDDEIDGVAPEAPRRRRLPKGISETQAKWIVDSDTDDYSDDDSADELEEDMEHDDDEEMGGARTEGMTDMEPTEYGDEKSEMFMDPSPQDENELRQIQEFRDRTKDAAEDAEFPDEIELEPTALARERLLRYRGLKNIRTSPWIVEDDMPYQPTFWNQLTRVENYKATKTKVTREQLIGGVAPGTKVKVYLRDAPVEALKTWEQSNQQLLTGVFSLLRHEHKKAVVNYSITLSTDYIGPPIKAKDTLILQSGSRRWQVRPVFSQGGATKNNVHKFERYLQPGRVCVATFVGEMGFGTTPVLWWKQKDSGELEMIGTGSHLNTDHQRVITKRKILTGHPYKIHKKVVTVRYMFFNTEDVHWFKALPLYTKRGRSGFIKESLGTHGYFKATFDGKLNPQDAVCISLYKRCFPLEAETWKGISA